MRLERFRGPTLSRAMGAVRVALGEDALVICTVSTGDGLEIVATTADEVARFGDALRPPPTRRRGDRRSQVVALVGPTGSGKTTTIAKLALNDAAFGGSRVGIISLDTYKIGAYDQIQTYADLCDMPLDVLTYPEEAPDALERMARCDVILVDTPGRAPRAQITDGAWRETLAALEPDETHLVMAASIRHHVADAFKAHYADLNPTHTLLTKLDEIPGEAGVAQLADRMALPARWITDGQVVPDDLTLAQDRLIESALRVPAPELMLEAIA